MISYRHLKKVPHCLRHFLVMKL